MPMTDEELVRRLESVPMVPSPDLREAVLSRISKPAARIVPFRRRPLALGLAWAAAVAIVIGIAVFRAPEPKPQNAAATMAPADMAITQSGDRYLVKGLIDWDRTRLERIETLPDGTAVLRAKRGASGSAEVRLRAAGGEVLKTSIELK
jgi:hypothetical protein